MKINDVVKVVSTEARRRSPEILTGLGIAGMITTTVLAVKATPKALELIEAEKEEINRHIRIEATAAGLEECSEVVKLTPVDTVKVTWKCYIPAGAMLAASVACLIGANTVSARRNAALAAAYAFSESTIREYRDKVVETIGEKKESTIRSAINKDHLEENPIEKNEVLIAGGGETLAFDHWSGRYFKSDINKIKTALNNANAMLLNENYLSLNSFYDELGLEGTQIGDEMGWNITQGLIQVNFDSQLATDGTPCLVIDFITRPNYDYDRWL